MADKPYVVLPDIGGGAANILDRVRGDRVGRVLQNFHGSWEAVDPHGTTILWCKYRSEAAAVVWQEYRAKAVS